MGMANGCCAAQTQQQQQPHIVQGVSAQQQQQQQQQQQLQERIEDLLSVMVSVTKAQKLLQDLQSPDESQQLTAAMEMCQVSCWRHLFPRIFVCVLAVYECVRACSLAYLLAAYCRRCLCASE